MISPMKKNMSGFLKTNRALSAVLCFGRYLKNSDRLKKYLNWFTPAPINLTGGLEKE